MFTLWIEVHVQCFWSIVRELVGGWRVETRWKKWKYGIWTHVDKLSVESSDKVCWCADTSWCELFLMSWSVVSNDVQFFAGGCDVSLDGSTISFPKNHMGRPRWLAHCSTKWQIRRLCDQHYLLVFVVFWVIFKSDVSFHCQNTFEILNFQPKDSINVSFIIQFKSHFGFRKTKCK